MIRIETFIKIAGKEILIHVYGATKEEAERNLALIKERLEKESA